MPRYPALPVTRMTCRVVAMLAPPYSDSAFDPCNLDRSSWPAHRIATFIQPTASGGGIGFVGGGSGDSSGIGVGSGIGFGSGSGGCGTGVIALIAAGSAPREICTEPATQGWTLPIGQVDVQPVYQSRGSDAASTETSNTGSRQAPTARRVRSPHLTARKKAVMSQRCSALQKMGFAESGPSASTCTSVKRPMS